MLFSRRSRLCGEDLLHGALPARVERVGMPRRHGRRVIYKTQRQAFDRVQTAVTYAGDFYSARFYDCFQCCADQLWISLAIRLRSFKVASLIS